MGIHLARATTLLSWSGLYPRRGSTTTFCASLDMRQSAAAFWSLQRIRPHRLRACVVGHADSCALTTVSDTGKLNCRNPATVKRGIEAQGTKTYSYMQYSAVFLSGFLAVNESPSSAYRKFFRFSLCRYLLLFSPLSSFFCLSPPCIALCMWYSLPHSQDPVSMVTTCPSHCLASALQRFAVCWAWRQACLLAGASVSHAGKSVQSMTDTQQCSQLCREFYTSFPSYSLFRKQGMF